MTDSEKAKGILIGIIFFIIGVLLWMMVIFQPGWTTAPVWSIYLIGFMAHLLGLTCIATVQDWRQFRNILIAIWTSILGLGYIWFAIGFGPRECLVGHLPAV